MKTHLFKLFFIFILPINILSAHKLDDIKVSSPSETRPNIYGGFIYTRVEIMPVYPGCESISSMADRDRCTEQSILNLIQNNLIHPSIPKDQLKSKAFGTKVFLTFVITKTGEVGAVEVIKGGYPELDKAALAAVKQLPKMIPGKQRGIPVNIKYTVPIQVELK